MSTGPEGYPTEPRNDDDDALDDIFFPPVAEGGVVPPPYGKEKSRTFIP